MTRLRLCATLVLGLAAVVQVAGRQDAPTFRGLGDAVRVFATVTDRDGRLVTDLGREHFEIRDNKKPQPITIFDNTPQPIRLVVMLDVSGSMHGNLELLLSATDHILTRLLPDDVARIGTFGRRIEISPEFTDDPDELRDELPNRISPDAPTPLWQALNEALDAFGDTEEDEEAQGDSRRVVLLLSDGKDSGPMGFRARNVSQKDVTTRVRDEDVMVYAIGMWSRAAPGRRPPPIGMIHPMMANDAPDPGLSRIAEQSGGGYVEVRSGGNLDEAFARVADELHAQYLIGFAPPVRDGKVHKIDVKVQQKGLKARARRSYVAPKPIDEEAGQSTREERR